MNKPVIISPEQQKLFKVFILMDLYVQESDELLENEKKKEFPQAIYDKMIELQDLMIPILDKIYEEKTVRKSDFFQGLQYKLNYNLKVAIKQYR
ncbi:hypothetical protein [Polaribacter sp. IC073]|uniref:hypothetical protein n=1 Tax=Polaribacter sp. IC073 TaxID=2508540 RepID=UPI0011BF6A6A|nr:hypothetical protein [Polaribacter sp. IC073]TXD45885.1 hypothetical protein ES045_15790 [Polaribacter sp. IC073]